MNFQAFLPDIPPAVIPAGIFPFFVQNSEFPFLITFFQLSIQKISQDPFVLNQATKLEKEIRSNKNTARNVWKNFTFAASE